MPPRPLGCWRLRYLASRIAEVVVAAADVILSSFRR
jgi:hypothetical protein